MSRLAGRVAIITGAAGGIGSAAALLFCEEGASLVMVDLPDSPLQAVVDGILKKIPTAQIEMVFADVGQEASLKIIAESAVRRFQKIDILVNNAGVRAYEALAQTTASTWEKILSVNLLSYAYLIRECLPYLRSSGHASVVNISSTHAVNPRSGMGQYDVAKAGIVSMTKTLAFEEASHGVRVNAVCPGLTLTPFHVKRAQAQGKTEQDLRQEDVTHNIQKRWSDPREIAYPILWLASSEASFVTGSVLMVDGGTHV
ncbi:MAG: SDR family oxidoreductase [Betaproteobacteria bacterium]|jgi:NAD(P)-dependent dehydrogenase (short-subunit alcohol dehydrogenase family)|nr:SDR family oxidoreductase [Burkholderiales bacterium]NBX89410.1 SDR family oxidoreductase [Betaproteobacteria bacterium]